MKHSFYIILKSAKNILGVGAERGMGLNGIKIAHLDYFEGLFSVLVESDASESNKYLYV